MFTWIFIPGDLDMADLVPEITGISRDGEIVLSGFLQWVKPFGILFTIGITVGFFTVRTEQAIAITSWVPLLAVFLTLVGMIGVVLSLLFLTEFTLFFPGIGLISAIISTSLIIIERHMLRTRTDKSPLFYVFTL